MSVQEENQNKIREYLTEMKSIQQAILQFIEKENMIKDDYDNIIKFLASHNIHEDQHDLKAVLHLLSNISNDHHRTPDFFAKIEHILSFLQEPMKKFYSNFSIFRIFQRNKRILLYLFEEKVIVPDELIASIITKDRYINEFYPEYFYTEFKNLFNSETIQKVESMNHRYKRCSEFAEKDPELFEQKRKKGENDEFICQLIRNDSIDRFIVYVNKHKLSYTDEIQPSIFETNLFLMNKRPTLIEYSALFGSVLIFRFLCVIEVLLTPSLWLYAIHGRNFELIQLLEENKIKPNDASYKECFIESIKCHHLKLAKFFVDKISHPEKDQNLNESYIKYHNYEYIPINLDKNFFYFYDLCQFDYFKIVEILLKTTTLNLNSKRILNRKKKNLFRFKLILLFNNISYIVFVLIKFLINIDLNDVQKNLFFF